SFHSVRRRFVLSSTRCQGIVAAPYLSPRPTGEGCGLRSPRQPTYRLGRRQHSPRGLGDLGGATVFGPKRYPTSRRPPLAAGARGCNYCCLRREVSRRGKTRQLGRTRTLRLSVATPLCPSRHPRR